MTCIADETQQRLAALEKIRHENPATQGDAPWSAEVSVYLSVQSALKRAPRKGPAP